MKNAEAKIWRRRLQDMKQDLLAQCLASEGARRPVALDQQSVGRLSRMDALQEQAMQLATERRRQGALLRIDAALARIADGEYGYCASCGHEIAARRLEQDPAVAACVNCARRS